MGNDKFSITFPSLAKGQLGWALYADRPKWDTPADTRTHYQKTVYWILMRIHNKAEKVWHWAYRVSREYDAPQSKIIGSDPLYLGTWGKDGERIEDTVFSGKD